MGGLGSIYISRVDLNLLIIATVNLDRKLSLTRLYTAGNPSCPQGLGPYDVTPCR